MPGVVGSISDTFPGLTGNAQAVSYYGQLGAASSTTFSFATPQQGFSFAIAEFYDTITISDPAFNGYIGSFSVSYKLNGSTQTTGAGTALAQVAVDVGSPTFPVAQIYDVAYTSASSANQETSTSFEFVFGQPFTFDMCLGAGSGNDLIPAVLPTAGHVTTSLCGPGTTGPQSGTGSGTSSFFDTLVLSGFQVSDFLGRPVNVQISSESGTQYQAVGAIAPEPNPIILSSFALAAVILFRRKLNEPR